jgi:hypothetical protein
MEIAWKCVEENVHLNKMSELERLKEYLSANYSNEYTRIETLIDDHISVNVRDKEIKQFLRHLISSGYTKAQIQSCLDTFE